MSSATTDALAVAANEAIEGLTISVASRVTSLGSGLGAGCRRNMKQVAKRLRAFKRRKFMFKRLRRAGVRTDRLMRTGGIAFLTFGQRALGVSSSLLLDQRRGGCCYMWLPCRG